MADQNPDTAQTLLVIGSVFVVLYGLLFAGTLLLSILAVVIFWLVYLFWRLVSAAERIARELESRQPQ